MPAISSPHNRFRACRVPVRPSPIRVAHRRRRLVMYPGPGAPHEPAGLERSPSLQLPFSGTLEFLVGHEQNWALA